MSVLAEPGAIELEHRRTGTGSSALYQSWLDMPLHVYLTGLFGCTAVAIVSRQGVWIGHFWESPSFFGDDAQFQTQVIGAIINGDTSRMPSPFPLAKSGEILSSGTNVQIFISTPLDPESNNGALLYKDRVGLIESTLTGEGCPFNGVPVTTWGYVKAKNEEVDELAETARSKVLIQYDNNQVNDPPKPQQQAIWRVWLEAQMYQDEWDATDAQRAGSCANTGNQKRQAEVSCSRPAGSSLTSGEPTGFSSSAASFSGPNGSLTSAAVVSPSNGVSSAVLTSSATNSSVNQQNTLTVFHAHSDAKLPPPLTSITPSQTSSNAVPSPTFSLLCYPFQDPDAGPAPPECQCDGLDGTFPYLSSSTSQSNYNPCGFTTTPTTASTTAAAFTTTESNGNVVSCASSTYYNFAVNMVPMCAGATSVISTVASIASVYSVSTASVTSIASVSAASLSAISASAPSAAAVYASAAAVPSAGCWILSDDGYGDSSFEVYGINGWAGSEGENLFEQEEGCGILTGFRFHTDEQDEFEGQMRDTQYAYFGLSFFKGGCVERAVHSAGGPPPGTEPGHLACQHASHLSGNQSDAVGGIATAQAKAVKSVANGGSTNSSLSTSDEEKAVVDTSSSSPETMEGPQPDASLVASASAALPHLLAAQSASSNGHDRRKAG